MMTLAERGIAAGYGGIWNEIDYPEDYKAKKAAEPKKVFKYEAVFDYDVEDMGLKDEIFFPCEEAKKIFFSDKFKNN